MAAILKAIHARERRSAARVNAQDIIDKLKVMKLAQAAELVAHATEETLTYYGLPGRSIGADAGGREATSRLNDPMGFAQIHECRVAQGDGQGSRLRVSLIK